MAEFEQHDNEATPLEWLLPDGRPLPTDFTADEVTLAQSLQTHFDIAGENLPPRYAQTLLGDPRHAPASDDFEERMITSVFQALRLARPTAAASLVPAPRAARHTWRQFVQRTKGAVQRSAVGLMALLMVLAYNATGTGVALASVLQLVVGRGGVQSVAHYPTLSQPPAPSLRPGDPTIEFLPQWAGSTIDGYSFSGIDVYPSRWWTNGALTVLHYQMMDADGEHDLSLLEFQPHVQVALQVVQDGSASNTQLGVNSGVFVSGKWIYIQGHPVWQPGTRAEFICHSPLDAGVVIWIAADNVPSGDEAVARSLVIDTANALQTLHLSALAGTPLGLRYINTSLAAQEQSFNGDVVELAPNTTDPRQPALFFRIDLSSDQAVGTHYTNQGMR